VKEVDMENSTTEELRLDRNRWRSALMSLGGGGEHADNPQRLVDELMHSRRILERHFAKRLEELALELEMVKSQRDRLLQAVSDVQLEDINREV
jgi:hypothetical protein